MHRRLILKLGLASPMVLTLAAPALAAYAAPSSASNAEDWQTLAVALTFLLPVGLILLSAAAFSEEGAISAATGRALRRRERSTRPRTPGGRVRV